MSARILTCSQSEYFADAGSEVPRLSQSIAHKIIAESCLHAWHAHPKLGAAAHESTKEQDQGTLLHSMLLGQGAEVEIIYADSFRTKAVQVLRDAAIEAGKVPMLVSKYEQLQNAQSSLRASLAAYNIVLSGDSEVKLEWSERGERGPVLCRGMLDHVVIDRGIIYDVKKIRSAHPRVCSRHMIEYGYDIQHAAYTSALAKLRPDLEGRIEMVFLFMEIEPPYSILPARPDGTMRELGSMKWNRAVALWERCLLNNRWPGYADSVVSLPAPAWALTEEIGTDANW